MGALAVRELNRLIANRQNGAAQPTDEGFATVLLQPQLIVRESSRIV